jgi:predicted esterase
MAEREVAAGNLHQGLPLLTRGAALDKAKAAMLMVHGRGASPQSILELAEELDEPGFAYVAPTAKGNTWYPYSFLSPIENNEPWLSSALLAVEDALAVIQKAGIPAERTILLGFSQGACLTLEFAARHAQRYGGLVGLSGGLIGPDDTPRDYPGSFEGTPAFLGCSDIDPHIPKERVLHTDEVLTRMGAQVTARLYRNMGHTVNRDEISFVRNMMKALVP